MPLLSKPLDIDDLLRDILRRLTLLERRSRRTSVGDWSLQQVSDGSLVARNARTGEVKTLAE